MSPQFLQTVASEEVALAIIVQLIGMFLILSSTAMFMKQTSLHKLENLQQMNMLLCSTIFLMIDWILVLPGDRPCEIFTIVFIVFGSASTFSTVLIAFGRYKTMMGLSYPVAEKAWFIIELLIVWVSSLLLVVYPVLQKIILTPNQTPGTSNNTEKYFPATGPTEVHVCFFKDSLIYNSYYTSIIFMCSSMVLPVGFILFFYGKILKRIRQARLSSWLNHVALQRSRQTQVIQRAGRKANVFQLTSSRPNEQNVRRFNHISSQREKSVFLKGLFAICVIVLCWLPFTAVWLHLTIVGYQRNFAVYIKYLAVNAKVSVILNVLHYICFNVKYRNLYIQTVFGPFTKFLSSLYTETHEMTCPIESQIATCHKSSVFTTRNSRAMLEPIQENEQIETDIETNQKVLKRRRSSKMIIFQRAFSLPLRFSANNVCPVENMKTSLTLKNIK